MRIIKVQNIKNETNNCYTASINYLGYPGECVGIDRKSSLMLFENGIQLSPSSASHDHVRNVGMGAFSHWGNSLYFSSSDNSNPILNGREYFCVLPNDIRDENNIFHESLLMKAFDSDFIKTVLSSSMSLQGSELHSIYSLRFFKILLEKGNVRIEGSTFLEIGASTTSGLAIALGLAGAKKVILNNIEGISLKINISFAENITMLCGLIMPLRRKLEEVVDIAPDGKTCKLKSNIYIVLDSLDAKMLPKYVSEPIDIMFSFSVMEHMRNLSEVVNSLHNIASRDCIAIHAIDARDHTDFMNPLKFLYLKDEEFDLQYSHDHNRWRISDYVQIFLDAGWKVKDRLYFSNVLPTLPNGNTDIYSMLNYGLENMIVSEVEKVSNVITKKEFSMLDKQFRRYTLNELSTLVFILFLSPV